MIKRAEIFYKSIAQASSLSQSDLISYFLYFLNAEAAGEAASAIDINKCFEACDLNPPTNTSARLIEGTKTRPPKYIRSGSGYKLHRDLKEHLSEKLGTEKIVTQTSTALRNLQDRLPEGSTKKFLGETIECFGIGANRATIVMAWCLAVDHLQNYIFEKKKKEFDAVLATNTDKRIKIKKIEKFDDFSDMPESKFIEFARSAKVISNDVRKILEVKLGIRNSAAHPSDVAFGKAKVIDFVEDLIENVVLKYPR